MIWIKNTLTLTSIIINNPKNIKMKKTMLIVILLGFFTMQAFTQVKTLSNTANITKVTDSTFVLGDKAVIPANQFVSIHSPDGKLLTTYVAGETVSFVNWAELKAALLAKKKAPPTQECTKIACPSGSAEGSVCWSCKPTKPA